MVHEYLNVYVHSDVGIPLVSLSIRLPLYMLQVKGKSHINFHFTFKECTLQEFHTNVCFHVKTQYDLCTCTHFKHCHWTNKRGVDSTLKWVCTNNIIDTLKLWQTILTLSNKTPSNKHLLIHQQFNKLAEEVQL